MMRVSSFFLGFTALAQAEKFLTALQDGETEKEAGGTIVRWLGNSGKFRVGSEGTPNNEMIEIFVNAVEEKNDDGTTTSNKVQNLASSSFTSEEEADYKLGNVTTHRVSMTSMLGPGNNKFGKLVFDTYLIKSSGEVGLSAEGASKAKVEAGNVKFNIKLSDWSWTSSSGGMIDVSVTVKARAPAVEKDDEVELGDGATMEINRDVLIDRERLTQFPDGYPSVSSQGNQQTYVFRFERFENDAECDPIVRISGAQGVTSFVAFLLLLLSFA